MSISDFYIEIESLDTNIKRVSQALSEWQNVNHYARGRLIDTALDIVGFADIFAQAHINATFWATEQTAEVNRTSSMESFSRLEKIIKTSKTKAGQDADKSMRDLKVAYKGYFFFIRAFHDAACAVLINLNGETPGEKSRMSLFAIENKMHPVSKAVSSVSGYIGWFDSFKKNRDKIKSGANFSLCGPQWDVGIGFNIRTPEGGIRVTADPEKKVRVGDIVQALKFTNALIGEIEKHLSAKNAVSKTVT